MHKKRIIVLMLGAVLVLSLAAAFAGDKLLLSSDNSGGVNAGDDISFTVTAPDVEEGQSYTLNVAVSPSVDLSCSAGSCSGGSFKAGSDEVAGKTLTFKFSTDSAATGDVTYAISASVSGDVSDSGSLSITATAAAQEDNTGDETGDDTGDTGDDNTGDSTEDNTGDTTGDNTDDTQQADNKGNGNQMPNGMNGMPSGKGAGFSGSMSAASISGSSSSSDSSTTYLGSADNYLKKLKVADYKFSQSFNKTNDTYFITVPKGTESVDITATPCDSSADVAITGTDDLKTGRNKVMVSVTADNGDVRVYRIYVTVSDKTAKELKEEKEAAEEAASEQAKGPQMPSGGAPSGDMPSGKAPSGNRSGASSGTQSGQKSGSTSSKKGSEE